VRWNDAATVDDPFTDAVNLTAVRSVAVTVATPAAVAVSVAAPTDRAFEYAVVDPFALVAVTAQRTWQPCSVAVST
jgi:hypothetical protein